MSKVSARGAPFKGAAASILGADARSPVKRRVVRSQKLPQPKVTKKDEALKGAGQNVIAVNPNARPKKFVKQKATKGPSSELERLLATPDPQRDELKLPAAPTNVLGGVGKGRRKKKEEPKYPANTLELPNLNSSLSGLHRLVEAPPTSVSHGSEQSNQMPAEKKASEPHYDEDAVIRKGMVVLYKERTGNMTEVEVLSVDYSLAPPSYLIRINGSERETERNRLFVPTAKTPEYHELESLLRQMRSRRAKSSGSVTMMSVTRRLKLEFMVVGARHLPKLDNTKPQKSPASED
eukprot:72734-Rhodomonas_salina.1